MFKQLKVATNDPIAHRTWGADCDCDLPPMSRVSWQTHLITQLFIDRMSRWREVVAGDVSLKNCNGIFKTFVSARHALYLAIFKPMRECLVRPRRRMESVAPSSKPRSRRHENGL